MTQHAELFASWGMLKGLRVGYSLVELVVALLVFTVGGLGLVATSAIIGRELSANATRERAARMAGTRLEVLAGACRGAGEGQETIGGIVSRWSVGSSDPSRVSLVESVTYPTRRGARTDVYRAVVACRP